MLRDGQMLLPDCNTANDIKCCYWLLMLRW